MNETFVWAIDILRVVEEYDRVIDIDAIAKRYYLYDYPIHITPSVRKFYIDNHIGFAVEENENLSPHPLNISDFLKSVTTPQYKLDRCFDVLLKQCYGGPATIYQLVDRQKLRLDESELILLESQMIESGLVDSSKPPTAFYYSLSLNTKGIVALNVVDSYSIYKKDAAEQEYEKNLSMHITEEERNSFAEKVILYLFDNEKEGVVFKFKNLMSTLEIPFAFHTPVYNKLFNSNPRLMDGKTGINSEVCLSQYGKQLAKKLKSKIELDAKHQEIELHKSNALTVLKEYGIGKEAVWNNIAKQAGVPPELSEDIKNILYHEGFVVRTRAAQGMGDLIKGQPSISVHLLGLRKEKIPSIMNHTVITNTGDGNVVNTGDNSTLTVTTIITKSNLESLKKHLTEAGLSKDDINELEQVIDNDNTDIERKVMGSKVKAWMQKMFGKSIDTSWKVGIGAAGKLLADAITRYYGW